MKKVILAGVFVILALIMLRDNATAQDENQNDGRTFGLSRMDLVIPDEIWSDIRARVGYEGRPLGYSADEMGHFKNSKCILRNVEMLFRDITSVPQFSGRFGDEVLADPSNFALTTFAAYRTLDAYAARVLDYPLPDGWGVNWLEDNASFDEVLETVAVTPGHTRPGSVYNWNILPNEIKTLMLRVVVAAIEAKPWLLEAFDHDFLKAYFETDDIGDITMQQLYEFASAPWQDNDGQPVPRQSFEALDKFDMRYFATGSNYFLRQVHAAIREYQLAIEESNPDYTDFNYYEFHTELGRVAIFGDGSDTIIGDESLEYFLIVDLGGDDIYTGQTAVPLSLEKPFGIVIDLGGNDTYDSGDESAALACGNHGIGAIFDLEGDDVYTCHESGIACAWFGTGLVVDYSGDDRYESHIWSQGAAHAGVGALIDLSGDDY
ncbi:MAG TPA: hypothetical protein ENN67_03505, partial [Firmicutes bacterium]|nr:hypothetical protein [Bacillota bacterium]